MRSRPRRAGFAVAALLVLGAAAIAAAEPCPCRPAPLPRCADPAAKHAIVTDVAFDVVDGTIEIATQSGPYRYPAAALDGKTIFAVFLPRGEVFQGFLDRLIPGGIALGTMHGAQGTLTTGAIFPPGEYEMALVVDVNGDGPGAPTTGDLAAFDNGVCEPTGGSIRVAVGCDDAHVTLGNRHFINF